MTTTMNRTAAQSVRPTVLNLPSRDECRDGMNKLRDKLNCPVLSVDEQALADDLLEYDWSYEPCDDASKEMPIYAQNASALIKEYQREKPERQSVDDYLKQQYRDNMLARYPDFECRTDRDIAALKNAVDQMYMFNAIAVMALVFALVIAAFAWLI